MVITAYIQKACIVSEEKWFEMLTNIRQIINIDEKQKRAQYGALWNSIFDGSLAGYDIIYLYILSSIGQVTVEPLICYTSYSKTF